MMDSYPPFTEIPHIVPVSGVAAPTYETYDPSLPADHPFVTRASQFGYHVNPLDQSKAHEAALPSQPWWKGDESPFAMGYLPTEFPAYDDRFSPWNSGLSTISDPQSPRSSNSGSVPVMNCMASPHYHQEELPITATTTIDDQTGYPAPDSLVDVDHGAIPKSRVFEIQPDHRSHFEHDLDAWSGSQSDRNVSPESQWPSPHHDATVFPTSARRTKGRGSISRVQKPTVDRRPTSAPARNRRRGVNSASAGEMGAPRVFVCSFAPYGCESTFVSKNEWKRHVTSQHLKLGFYRCDVGKCGVHAHRTHPQHNHSHYLSPVTPLGLRSSTPPPGQPNDFNRKDLFTQHQRRMHAPWLQSGRRRTPTETEHANFEASLEEVRQRCWHGLRQPPQQSHCGFCPEVFSGDGSWDARMEHVGRHFEREDRHALGDEVEDLAVREWGLREGILTLADGDCRLVSLVRGEI